MISVIIPARNEEKYISNCISGLKSQKTYEKFEILVVNNNSSDKTKEVALSFGIKVVDEPNHGLAAAKNTGARNAHSDILCFIDADCQVPNDHLEKISRLLTKYPNVSAFGGPTFYYDAKPLAMLLFNKLKYFYFYHRFTSWIGGFTSLSGGNTVVKKSAFDAIGGFNENMNNIHMPEDLDLSKRLYKAGFGAKFVPELFIYSSARRYARGFKLDFLTRSAETTKILFGKN